MGRPPATVTVSGDGTYDADGQAFRDHRTLSEVIQFRGKDGTDQEVRNVTMHPEGLVIGHRVVRNTIRYQLGRMKNRVHFQAHNRDYGLAKNRFRIQNCGELEGGSTWLMILIAPALR